MDCIREHFIQLGGQVAESDLNARSPLRMTLVGGDAASTLFTVRADQSGLIGLIRHLHGLGFVLLSVNAVDASSKGGSDVN